MGWREVVARTVVVLGVGLWLANGAVAQITLTNTPTADAFVRSLDPTHNYGSAGALEVSGSIATNPTSGLQEGSLDSFLQFNLATDISTFNSAFGVGQWTISGVTLAVTASTANNADFNYGAGGFEVRWIGDNAWQEGTGTPNTPGTNGIRYAGEPGILNSDVDESLGTFNYNGATSGQIKLTLGSPAGFISEISTGSLVSLYMTATPGSTIGFTFNSRNFTSSSAWPMLDITAVAVPEPSTLALFGLSCVFLAFVGGGRRNRANDPTK
ncbi:MAG TPA: PEP-CTERM sorting domain-containing protein [Verrucomicrobiae bacterium]|nr:PEP-CTERM sorting domain-containing protein [Verrucomicrobiae bacterium]